MAKREREKEERREADKEKRRKDGEFERKRGGRVHRAEGGRAKHGTSESMMDGGMDPDNQTEDTYAGQESNVRKEAKGAVRKRGGRVEMKAEGERPKERLDRKRRATGGRVGADSHPLSSAAKDRPSDDRPYSHPQ